MATDLCRSFSFASRPEGRVRVNQYKREYWYMCPGVCLQPSSCAFKSQRQVACCKGDSAPPSVHGLSAIAKTVPYLQTMYRSQPDRVSRQPGFVRWRRLMSCRCRRQTHLRCTAPHRTASHATGFEPSESAWLCSQHGGGGGNFSCYFSESRVKVTCSWIAMQVGFLGIICC